MISSGADNRACRVSLTFKSFYWVLLPSSTVAKACRTKEFATNSKNK
jgi:hypothetical protein